MASRHTIQIVSHGPGCLDGVVAAAAVGRFYQGHRVIPIFASNSESDRTIQGLRLRAGGLADEIWITDLSWTSNRTRERLEGLARAGAKVFWIDHHRTAVSRATAPEFDLPFAGKVLTEDFSAARLVYNFLEQRIGELSDDAARQAFADFAPIAMIADDHDRWVHRIPESPDWALAVQTLGSSQSYREIMRAHGAVMSRKLAKALQAGREAMEKSQSLARVTLVERQLSNGLRLRTACCFGYSSEVAADLYQGQHQTIVALFDFRSQGVSLRRSPDCEVDLSKLAQSFGGGGHAAASGFALESLRRVPAEKLAEVLDRVLTGQS